MSPSQDQEAPLFNKNGRADVDIVVSEPVYPSANGTGQFHAVARKGLDNLQDRCVANTQPTAM